MPADNTDIPNNDEVDNLFPRMTGHPSCMLVFDRRHLIRILL
jgi:hypothetical protein